nr:MAG TPA: hypothetical protein [Caudoviricetes sp.]
MLVSSLYFLPWVWQRWRGSGLGCRLGSLARVRSLGMRRMRRCG